MSGKSAHSLSAAFSAINSNQRILLGTLALLGFSGGSMLRFAMAVLSFCNIGFITRSKPLSLAASNASSECLKGMEGKYSYQYIAREQSAFFSWHLLSVMSTFLSASS